MYIEDFDGHKFERQFHVGKLIGKGGEAEIFEGTVKDTGLEVVLRFVKTEQAELGDFEFDNDKLVPMEYALMQKCQNIDGVVKLLMCFETKSHYIYVLQKISDVMDIFDFTEKYEFGEETAKTIIKQLVKILIQLQNIEVRHADLHSQNLLIDDFQNLYLIDFGLAEKASDTYKTIFSGTELYILPEFLRHGKYLQSKAETYHIGIILHLLLFYEEPFQNRTEIFKGKLKEFPEVKISESAKSLLESLLHIEPKYRPTLEGILSSKWLQEQ